MQIDVFTLFPDWFHWFREQRHVANALARGTDLTCVNPRDFTPLSGGQVDDTPFGGGAGMVLRVDVMDAALKGHYNRDPLDLRQERRVIVEPVVLKLHGGIERRAGSAAACRRVSSHNGHPSVRV